MRQIYLISLVTLLGVSQVAWSKPPPARNLGIHRREDKPPRIEDTLAVAKSPLEPITVSIGVPDARFNEFSKESALETTESLDEIKRTTRSSQDDSSTENGPASTESAPIEATSSATSPQESGSNSSSDEQPAGSAEPTTTTQASVSKVAAVETTTPDAPTTSSDTGATSEVPSDEPIAASTVTTTTSTTTTPAPEVVTTVETSSVAPMVVSESSEEHDAPKDIVFSIVTTTTTTTTTTPEPTTAATEAPTTTTTTPAETTTVAVISTTTITTTTEAPTSSVSAEPAAPVAEPQPETNSPKEDSTPSTTVQPATDVDKTTSSEASATNPPPATSEEPEVGDGAKPEVEPPQSSGIEKEEPSPAVEQPTPPEQPSSTEATSTTTTTTTTEKPSEAATNLAANEDTKEESNKRAADCNHLPTYNSDEVQKVFREETTFKNGTIKGKFTYINYDQRYRLVHYTRLPYGPVKIDLVEELGRPQAPQATPNQSAPTSTTNEVPNAVLQLRNILPNSLFGFPFLNPNSGFARQNGLADNNDDRATNMYFYSTDTLSTPNLLTPSVPVSVPPSQRVKPTTSQAAALNPTNYLDQAVASKQPEAQTGLFGLPSIGMNSPVVQERRQFQYASTQAQPEQVNKPLVYTYLTPAHQYQYAPQSIYQPINPHHQQYHDHIHQRLHDQQVAQARSFANNADQQTGQLIANKKEDSEPMASPIIGHHQPHSHEHYVAPFMFAQPPFGSANNPTEGSRIRLRVKTSKALNYSPERGTKSAQLRANQAPSGYSEPANSPVQAYHRHQTRQRIGKLNHELKAAPVNTSPVVYHVLRNPGGQVYTLPQYNQNYAVAYDRDN